MVAGRHQRWVNVIANSGFGFQVAAEGSGYTWCENSRKNQLTSWSNNPVLDPPGEAIFIREEDSGDLWTPTAQPIRDGGTVSPAMAAATAGSSTPLRASSLISSSSFR